MLLGSTGAGFSLGLVIPTMKTRSLKVFCPSSPEVFQTDYWDEVIPFPCLGNLPHSYELISPQLNHLSPQRDALQSQSSHNSPLLSNPLASHSLLLGPTPWLHPHCRELQSLHPSVLHGHSPQL